jgi:hypothetical protein
LVWVDADAVKQVTDSSMSWVTNTMVTANSSRTRRTGLEIAAVCASTEANGSSISRIDG